MGAPLRGFKEHTNNFAFFSGTEFEHLLHFVTEASQHGIGVLDGDLRDNNWSLGQSFLFTVTVVTTVGKTIQSDRNQTFQDVIQPK